MPYNRTAKPDAPKPTPDPAHPDAKGELVDVCYRAYPPPAPRPADRYGPGYAPTQPEVLAVFPGLPGTNCPYTCTCYAHVGQHSSCDPLGVVADTRPATPEEYATLHRELTAVVGYNLRIVTRCNRAHYLEQRRDEIQAQSDRHAARNADAR